MLLNIYIYIFYILNNMFINIILDCILYIFFYYSFIFQTIILIY